MCTVCGCDVDDIKVDGHSHHDIHYHHDVAAANLSGMSRKQVLSIEEKILSKNDQIAAQLRDKFKTQNILALNLMSSPGSGKTTLLVRTIEALKEQFSVAVVEGDQQTNHDAERIRAAGVTAVQINTGKGCHLDANMVQHGIEHLKPENNSVLFIENVGNLVCPSAFDLGETYKVVILSVTEGEDKPIKYPDMFHAADIMLLTKSDLLPHLDFDVDQCIEYARRINPDINVVQLSAHSGENMQQWYSLIQQLHAN